MVKGKWTAFTVYSAFIQSALRLPVLAHTQTEVLTYCNHREQFGAL